MATANPEIPSATKRRRRWTLRRKLVVGTSALMAAALLVTSLATIIALRSFVFERLDAQVLEGLDFATGPRGPMGAQGQDPGAPPGGGYTPQPDTQPGASPQPGTSGGLSGSSESSVTANQGPAARIGSLQVILAEDGSAISSSYTLADGTEVTLTDDQIGALADAATAERVPTTVDLGSDLGSFRVASERVADASGERIVIAGNSIRDATATTGALVMILVAVGGSILLIAIIGISLLVARNLRPLDRVADVAQRVSGRHLSAGDVEIPERVDAADTDGDTEVGRVGKSLNELLGHVESALAARQHSEDQLRRFIADASHELRTPLASIRGYAQLSLRGAEPMTATQRRSLDRIESESERMSALVDDLLLLARLDAGQTLNFGTVELSLVAIDAVSDAHAVDPTRTWELDISEELISAPGDENRIRQVLANLLRNARTHTPPGTVVTVSLARDATHAILRVADDGPGIDPEVRDRLFDRFVRGDQARNRDAGSTGLGLSIAHAITTAHGGTITAESAPGGAVFTVRLPLEATPE
ncbi:MAG: sensor histidine kinase [Leucobacter sp.]